MPASRRYGRGVTFIPGAREIRDPQAETDRLAWLREDPPWREWGVRHPGGTVTVRVDGHPFQSRQEAESVRTGCDEDCEWCGGGPHGLVCRDREDWRDAP